jgi:hypothetical protein
MKKIRLATALVSFATAGVLYMKNCNPWFLVAYGVLMLVLVGISEDDK